MSKPPRLIIGRGEPDGAFVPVLLLKARAMAALKEASGKTAVIRSAGSPQYWSSE